MTRYAPFLRNRWCVGKDSNPPSPSRSAVLLVAKCVAASRAHRHEPTWSAARATPQLDLQALLAGMTIWLGNSRLALVVCGSLLTLLAVAGRMRQSISSSRKARRRASTLVGRRPAVDRAECGVGVGVGAGDRGQGLGPGRSRWLRWRAGEEDLG